MRPKTIFEVGDRVMALGDGYREQKGDMGTVIGFLDEHQSNVSVDWDTVCDGHNGSCNYPRPGTSGRSEHCTYALNNMLGLVSSIADLNAEQFAELDYTALL